MFFFNFLFWICGTLILALAVWLRVSKDGKEIITAGNSGQDPYIAVNILIAVGAIIMVLGFLGCCGAVKESRCMLLLFFIGLLLILLLQVTAGILGASFKSEYSRILNETLHNNAKLLSEVSDEAKEFQMTMTSLQAEFKCCGLIQGPEDWGNNFENAKESCNCTGSHCKKFHVYSVYPQSCLNLIKDAFEKNIIIVIGIAFGLAVIEVLGLVFSMVLYCQIGKR